VDLAIVPPRGTPRQLLTYLNFDAGPAYYHVDNTLLGTRFSVRWDGSVLPYAWFFQEMDAGQGYPWFGTTYVMAIEPSSTKPGRGLAHAVEAGIVTRLEPGASDSISISASITAL